MGGVPVLPRRLLCARGMDREESSPPPSFPRRRESRVMSRAAVCIFWIPAFAGMTVGRVREEVLVATERRPTRRPFGLRAEPALGCAARLEVSPAHRRAEQTVFLPCLHAMAMMIGSTTHGAKTAQDCAGAVAGVCCVRFSAVRGGPGAWIARRCWIMGASGFPPVRAEQCKHAAFRR